MLTVLCCPHSDTAPNWLALCVLLPRPAILEALKRRQSVGDMAAQFGASETLVRFRVQKTGAQAQIKRSRIA
jgi:Zn-dependent peptidase ImmA (M78 family)